MNRPPVVSIHVEFPAASGLYHDPTTGYCVYNGVSVFWFRSHLSEEVGYPVTLPMTFSFYLPFRARHVDLRASPGPPHTSPNEPEPMPAILVRMFSPEDHNSRRQNPSETVTSPPPPRRVGPRVRVTARKSVIAQHRRMTTREYRNLFNPGETSRAAEMGVPVIRIEDSEARNEADDGPNVEADL